MKSQVSLSFKSAAGERDDCLGLRSAVLVARTDPDEDLEKIPRSMIASSLAQRSAASAAQSAP
ncbi:hypothetical protein CUJ84_Chr002329 [Rhizobium leguminosarum]|uniref:Uncharacterized protein n=1 Tax=Rhizobium leguminosarum TaxID=384 RepID=A0A2K9Z377_RHILE|nr:hypothetical protein CUJ84_Chr002329 [Rhizobium leguminosarum]